MQGMMKRYGWMLLAGLILVMSGCGEVEQETKETDERAFRRGQSFLREGRHQEALNAFLTVIESRRVAPESHLEAGLIYLHHLRDPLAAIYHFRKYLEVRPNADQSQLVRDRIVSAQREFIRTLPGDPFAGTMERVDLVEKTRSAQDQNLELREALAQSRSRVERLERDLLESRRIIDELRARIEGRPVSPVVIAPPAPPPTNTPTRPAARSTTYTVQPGDTLSRVSQQVYGTPARWAEIFEANRDTLASPNALRVGQELRIP